MHIYIYIYIYINVCVSVQKHDEPHTVSGMKYETLYIVYMYIHVFMYIESHVCIPH